MVVTEMLEKMRVKPGDDDRTVLSKKLSYVLRHGAPDLALFVGDGGHVRVKELLAIDDLFGEMTEEALLKFVSESNTEKQRYELLMDDGQWLIRATGKHTIQGIGAGKDKERKKWSGEGARGNRRGTERDLIDEDEFCARWKLDRFARSRLSALPSSIRQLAMTQFSPGPQVDATDFPKVFVAFCKRYKAIKGEDAEAPFTKGGNRGAAGFAVAKGRLKKASSKPRKVDSGDALGFTMPSLAGDASETELGGASENEFNCAGYDSPGSSPRGLHCDNSVLSLSMGTPPGSRWHPPQEPPKIPARLSQSAGSPPPPPSHSPVVCDFGTCDASTATPSSAYPSSPSPQHVQGQYATPTLSTSPCGSPCASSYVEDQARHQAMSMDQGYSMMQPTQLDLYYDDGMGNFGTGCGYYADYAQVHSPYQNGSGYPFNS